MTEYLLLHQFAHLPPCVLCIIIAMMVFWWTLSL